MADDVIARAKNLKLALTAGVGSDHVDLRAAAEAGVTVAEVTGANYVSVAEHVVMMTLAQVRNYLPAHGLAANGGWNVSDCVERGCDVQGMSFGTIGRRPDRPGGAPAAEAVSSWTGTTPSGIGWVRAASWSTGTRSLRRCAPARSRRMPATSGTPQPAPLDHSWRTMPFNGMTPHISGTTLFAQGRYAAGTLAILQSFFDRTPIREDCLIVDGGGLAGTGARGHGGSVLPAGVSRAAACTIHRVSETARSGDRVVPGVRSRLPPSSWVDCARLAASHSVRPYGEPRGHRPGPYADLAPRPARGAEHPEHPSRRENVNAREKPVGIPSRTGVPAGEGTEAGA